MESNTGKRPEKYRPALLLLQICVCTSEALTQSAGGNPLSLDTHGQGRGVDFVVEGQKQYSTGPVDCQSDAAGHVVMVT